MTNRWCRLWHDMPTDPKFRSIARRSGRPLADVLAIFLTLMTTASEAAERGSVAGWDPEDAAAALDMEQEHARAIFAAMRGKVHDGQRLTGWDARQPQREDCSTERVRAYRERQRAGLAPDETHMKRNETHGNAPDSDPDRVRVTIPLESCSAREAKAAGGRKIGSKDGPGSGWGTELEPQAPEPRETAPSGCQGERVAIPHPGSSAEPAATVSAETRRRVAAKLAISDAEPLVRLFEAWPASRKARDIDALFFGAAPKIYANAGPEVRAACRPLAVMAELTIAANVRAARASPELIAALHRRH